MLLDLLVARLVPVVSRALISAAMQRTTEGIAPMICPGTTVDCDNPGCRRGGCQGRPPAPPLFQLLELKQPAMAARQPHQDRAAAKAPAHDREPVAA
jgi:hypothetical protein